MITDFLTLTEIAFIVVIVIPALLGLVNMLKRVGLPVNFAGPAAVALGVAVMVAYVAFGENRYFILGLVGLLVGLGVTGYYDLGKMFKSLPDFTDDREDVAEFVIGDTVYAGPANDMATPGEAIRPVLNPGEPAHGPDTDLAM